MPNWISRARGFFGGPNRLRRELVIAAVMLVFGLLVVPFLIWAAGRATLGDYPHGGPFSLFADFFRGLAAGGAAFWVAVIGPYVILTVGRLAIASARG